jgi:hypothetical protein
MFGKNLKLIGYRWEAFRLDGRPFLLLKFRQAVLGKIRFRNLMNDDEAQDLKTKVSHHQRWLIRVVESRCNPSITSPEEEREVFHTTNPEVPRNRLLWPPEEEQEYF